MEQLLRDSSVTYYEKKIIDVSMIAEVIQKQSPGGATAILSKTTALLRSATLLKNRLLHLCFHVNFAKFLRTSFFIEDHWWLLLVIHSYSN